MEYRKFTLSPGQQAPKGSTDQGMLDGSIVWVGEKDTFDPFAKFGKILTTDKIPSSKIESKIMTEIEIDEYNLLLKYQENVKDGYENLISFDDFKDADKFADKQIEIKNNIDAMTRS